METRYLVEAVERAHGVLRSFPSDGQALRAVQELIDVAEAARAELAHAVEGFTDDGAGSMKTWLRTELHLDAGEAGRVLRRGQTLSRVAVARGQARAGRIGPRHVDWYGYGLQHLGEDAVNHPALAGVLSEFATSAEPAQLKAAVKEVREQLTPDALDRAWIRGMDREDITVTPVGEHGYAVAGFLSITRGAKLQAMLDAFGRPRHTDECADPECADSGAESTEDERTPAERRLAALESVVDSVLEHGLPQDRGVRPHVSVLVDADELRKLADPGSAAATAPAHLAGFGSIGRGVLGQIMCGADLTPILTGGQDAVLDVGRTHRCATPRQRRAVNARQGNQCAAPGCTARVSDIHHVQWYSLGGPTDLHNLQGFCISCHHLIHAGKLVIDPETHPIRRPFRPPERRNRSNAWLTRRDVIERLRQALAPPHEPALTG